MPCIPGTALTSHVGCWVWSTYINKTILKSNLGYWGQQRYLGTPGAQHRTNLGMLKCNECLCVEERKRKFFTHRETRFLSFERGSFKDTPQGQVWEVFLIAVMSLPSCLAKDELMLFDKLLLTTEVIPSQPSHTIQFKTA